MHLNHEQNFLFTLIKSSLFSDKIGKTLLDMPEGLDWDTLFNLAAKQGVLCVAWDGLVQMERSGTIPKLSQIPGLSKELLVRWGLSVQKLEARNKRQKAAIKELVAIFKESGIEMLLLKGIGLGELYPKSNHRECGDIDIFLFGNYEKGNKIIEKLGIEVDDSGSKHSNFFFKGIPVENHKTFLNVEQTQTDKVLEVHLKQILNEQGYETIMLDDTPVRIPTNDFTAIFLSRHDITHFLASGLVLRHFCDMALFFEKNGVKNGTQINYANFEKVMRENGQYNLICSFLEIGQRYLGVQKIDIKETSVDHEQVNTLANRVLEDTFHNKYRAIDKNKLETMWVPRRKLLGLKMMFRSKWKYDSIENGLYFKSLIIRISHNFRAINWK